MDTIQVKGAEPEIVELWFSRHRPVFYRDTVNNVTYAIRLADSDIDSPPPAFTSCRIQVGPAWGIQLSWTWTHSRPVGARSLARKSTVLMRPVSPPSERCHSW